MERLRSIFNLITGQSSPCDNNKYKGKPIIIEGFTNTSMTTKIFYILLIIVIFALFSHIRKTVMLNIDDPWYYMTYYK